MQSLEQLGLDIKAFFSVQQLAVVDYVRVLNAHISITRVALEKGVLAV